MIGYYVIAHLATTCDESGVYVTKDSSEIIEFAWLFLNATTLEEVHRHSVLVKPVTTPITSLCTSLTTLTYEHVKAAGSFQHAIMVLDSQIRSLIQANNLDFAFVTLGSWDLRVQLPREARDKSVVLPSYLQYPRLFDLRTEYSKWQARHPEFSHCSPSSLAGICTALEVDTPLGNLSQPFGVRPRRAMEEVVLLANILKALVARSQPLEHHCDVLVRPIDARADMHNFLSEKSAVLHLANLPHDVTQGELESWFTQFGGRPLAFWTLRVPDYQMTSPSVIGFVVFGSHEDALECLVVMNGRAMNERAVQVSPSSPYVLERAKGILAPFPQNKNRPRPGDWNCPSCGFSNFQRRTMCFRCSFPGVSMPVDTNHDSKSPQANNQGGNLVVKKKRSGPNVPFRAGDWKCMNNGCDYHNFAKNMVCLKCGADRPESSSRRVASRRFISQPLQPIKQYTNAEVIYRPQYNNGLLNGGF
ncbi:hypothetical protein TRVA0_001S05952 [Trichomonascus vanleenenianus]|uniref:Nrp1p n=1 Tax=Trichomonascus vanleenenianus TaxID=2268995 RepID=UPI003ECB4B52